MPAEADPGEARELREKRLLLLEQLEQVDRQIADALNDLRELENRLRGMMDQRKAG